MAEAGHFAFTDVDLPMRKELRAELQHAWSRLAQPGTWFDGRERVAIAAESRRALNCELCRLRKAALSPSMVSGTHESNGDLPDAVVDIAHRVITDQGRITRSWVEGHVAAGINGQDAQGEYAEIVGVVVLIFSIDEFIRGIGAALEPLPAPVSGEPSRHRPANLESETGFVPMIPVGGDTGEDADVWDAPANVLRALSLAPDCVRDWIRLAREMYIPHSLMAQPGVETGRAIDRMQVELVAGRVSSHNECFY